MTTAPNVIGWAAGNVLRINTTRIASCPSFACLLCRKKLILIGEDGWIMADLLRQSQLRRIHRRFANIVAGATQTGCRCTMRATTIDLAGHAEILPSITSNPIVGL